MHLEIKGLRNSSLELRKKTHKDDKDCSEEAVFLANFLVWNISHDLLEKTMVYINKKMSSFIVENTVQSLIAKVEEPVITINYPDGDKTVATIEDAFNILCGEFEEEEDHEAFDDEFNGVPEE